MFESIKGIFYMLFTTFIIACELCCDDDCEMKKQREAGDGINTHNNDICSFS